MKVTVKRTDTEIEVEGTADEIRTGVPALLTPTTEITPATPVAPQAPNVLDVTPTAVVVSVDDVDEPSADVIRIDRQPEPVRELGERWQQEFPDIDIRAKRFVVTKNGPTIAKLTWESAKPRPLAVGIDEIAAVWELR